MTADSRSDPGAGGSRPVATDKRHRRRWIFVAIGLGIVVWLGFMTISLARALQDSHSALSAADASRASLAGLDTGPSSGLVGTLARRHVQLVTDLAKAQDGLTRSSAATKAAAALLVGPRHYLVMAANNAEMRAGSGIYLQAGIL